MFPHNKYFVSLVTGKHSYIGTVSSEHFWQYSICHCMNANIIICSVLWLFIEKQIATVCNRTTWNITSMPQTLFCKCNITSEENIKSQRKKIFRKKKQEQTLGYFQLVKLQSSSHTQKVFINSTDSLKHRSFWQMVILTWGRYF